MSAAGFASLAVGLDFSELGAQINKGLAVPLQKSAKQAGDSMEKSLTQSAVRAEKAVAKARGVEAKAAQEVEKATRKLEDAQGAVVIATGKKKAAEEDYARAVRENSAKVEAAEKRVAELKQSSTTSVEELAKAERDLESARSKQSSDVQRKETALESAREKLRKATRTAKDEERHLSDSKNAAEEASEALRKEEGKLASATDDAAESASDAGGRFGDLGDTFEGLKGKIGPVAGAIGGVLGAGALFEAGRGTAGAIANINNQLGYTGDTAKAVGDSVSSVLRSGVAASAEDAAGAVGALESQFKYLGFEGEQTAAELADNFIAFSDTFGVDIAEATQTAGQLIKNGLAGDVEEAADLMTVAMQKVPAQMRDELPEIINEYGTNFRALGFEGEEAFALLVDASTKGKWALDKTGDALKEFTIRGSDMSAASVEAYEAIGLNAEEMSSKIAEGGDGAREALQKTAEGILAIEDPAERANTAIALFGTPLEDLSVDQIPQFLDSLSGASGGMGDFAGASQRLSDNISNSFQGRLNSLKGTVSDLAEGAFMKLWDIVSGLADWAARNEAWLGPLVAGIAGVAAALGGIAAASSAVELAKGAVTGLSKAFGLLAAHPIVAVVAGVAAALVYFFTQTETGKAVWQSFMDALGAAWEWLQGVFAPVFEWLGGVITGVWNGIKAAWDVLWQGIQTAWDSVLYPVFSAIWTVVSTTLGVIGTIILAPLLIAWNALSWGIKTAWETLIKPAWDALSAAAQWMWTSVLQPVFNFIGNAWNLLLSGMKVVYDTILKPTWDALVLAAQWMWTNILQPIFRFIGDAWAAMVNGIKFVYDTILKPAWDALQNAAQWMYNNVLKPVFQWIGDRWNDMSRVLDAGRRFIVDTVFAGIQRGLDVVKNAFQATKDGIGKIWDGLRSVAAKPVKFVIDTVWNEGIVEAWNKIAGFIPGLDKVDKYKPAWLGQYATGGVLPGYTPGRDVHEFYSPTGGRLHLSGGEAIMRPEWTRAVGGPAAVERMNRDARSGKLGGQKLSHEERKELRQAHALGGIITVPSQAFANGGVVDAMINIVRKKYPQMVMTSGYRNSNDNHGRGLAADFAWPGAFGPHPAQLALANDIATTYPNSMELIYGPGFSRQIKNGQIVGDGGGSFGFYAGAGDHSNHVHWAMDTPPTMPFGGGVFEGGSSGGGGGGLGGWIASKAKGIWDKIVKPIKSGVDKIASELGGSKFGKIPGAAFEKIEKAAWEKISSLFGGGGGFGSVDLSGIAGDNRQIVQEVFKRYGWTGQQWADAEWIIMKESGFNNTAQNPTSTAYGMFQFLDTTWDDVGGSKTSDPKLQADYGAKYIQSRYGDPTKARRFWEANGWYADGGVLPENLAVFDTGGVLEDNGVAVNKSGKPERVLDPRWTQMFDKRFLPIMQELVNAYDGHEKEYKATAGMVGMPAAIQLINGISALGAWTRSDEFKEMNESIAKSVETAATDNAKAALNPFGLDPAVDIAKGVVKRVDDVYQASPYRVGVSGRNVTVTIEAEEGQNQVSIDQLRRLEKQVDWLKVKVDRKPRAAALTRGGVM